MIHLITEGAVEDRERPVPTAGAATQVPRLLQAPQLRDHWPCTADRAVTIAPPSGGPVGELVSHPPGRVEEEWPEGELCYGVEPGQIEARLPHQGRPPRNRHTPTAQQA